MAQAKEAREGDEKAAAPRGRPMPPGEGPVEYKLERPVPLPEAGVIVKDNWVGRVLGRRVRVRRGAPVDILPEPVRAALVKDGIAIGSVTYEECNMKPPVAAPGFVNLTQMQQQKAVAG